MGAHPAVAIVVADGEPLTFADVGTALRHAQALQPGRRVGVDAAPDREARDVAVALCTRAEPGQVLVSDRARWGDRDGLSFRDVGSLALATGSAPIAAWELLWAEPRPRTRVTLCGALRVEIDGAARSLPGGQAASLLAFLVVSPERAAARSQLIDVLWPRRAPREPQTALRPILSRLRRALAPATLEGPERLQLTLPEPVWVDVAEASRALGSARAAARDEQWAHTRAHAERARVLLAPGFLHGMEEEWAYARRQELEELELEALEWIARASLSLPDADLGAAQRASRELVARAPFRETGHRFLMEALAAGGNLAEALRVYDDLRVLLREELGTAPAAELQTLHQRLLAGEGARPTIPDEPAVVPLPRQLSPRERSAFVARERERGVLRAAWERARGGGRGLIFLAGEPGIGKTRLATEFAQEAHAHGTVLYAACQEEALVSYQPFVEILRHAGLDWEAVARMPGAAELARVIPELPAPPDAPARDAEMRRYLLFEAVATLLEQLAARAPLALVIDDLHWADRATLHLLRHVARAPREAPLLLVGTYRDAEVGPAHPLSELLADLRRDRLFDRVVLEGLAEHDVGALIAAHAGHAAPPALVGAVHEHTDGNPFFVEEVLRHLIETGVVFERGGRWTSALTADEIGVPEGVQEVLARRLARLSDPCRGVLAAAAVLGREWSFDVLRATLEGDDDALIGALEEAREHHLVVEVERDAGAVWAFTHALVRETLYSGLSSPRRERLHARAAAAIEAVRGDAEIAALALHQRLAGSTGDAEKAIDYSVRAGARAAELFAWEEAAAHWEGAVAAMARADGRERERARLLVALADLMVVSDVGGRIAHLEQALALYEGLGDEERVAQTHSRLGMAHALMDSIYAEHLDVRRAFAHFDAARGVLERAGRPRSLGHLEVGVATAHAYGLRIAPGREAAQRAMAIGEAVGDELLWAEAAEAFAWHAIIGGEPDEGFAMLERAFDTADRHRRPFLAFMAANTLGQHTWGIGAPDEAQAHFERTLRLPYVGDAAFRRQIADGIGRCHVSRGEMDAAHGRSPDATPTWITHSLKPLLDLWDGDWQAVDDLARRTYETSRRSGNRWDEWAAQHLAARVRRLRGEPEAAVALLEPALAIVVDGGARYFELWVRPDLARALAQLGRLEEAREHVERCRAIVEAGADWRGRAGSVALADAIVLAHDGRAGEAERRFAAARAVLERYALRGEEAELLHEWGRLLGAPDRLDEAAELYRRHGAGRAWLERVEADRRRLA